MSLENREKEVVEMLLKTPNIDINATMNVLILL